jgi:cytochrome P450
MKHLLLERERWEAIVKEPSIIPQAVEEILRFDTVSPNWRRTASEDTEVGGVSIPKGAILLLSLGSANHDEAYFKDPERFDMRRENASAHLGFSRGVHYCVGAPLGRLEAQVALDVLSKRLPAMRLVEGQAFEYQRNVVNRGLKHLLVEWPSGAGG